MFIEVELGDELCKINYSNLFLYVYIFELIGDLFKIIVLLEHTLMT